MGDKREEKGRVFFGSLETVELERLKRAKDGDSKEKKLAPEILAGIKAGNINITPEGNDKQTMELSESSRLAKMRHDTLVRQLEAKRKARTIMVPTSDLQVRKKLRQLGEPITLFGELPPDRRERLRAVMATLAVEQSDKLLQLEKAEEEEKRRSLGLSGDAHEPEGPYSTEGTSSLLNARIYIAKFSIPRARTRVSLQKEVHQRELENESLLHQRQQDFQKVVDRIKGFSNVSSEIGCYRPISACHFSPNSKLLATASWSGICKVWGVPESKHLLTLRGHSERVIDIAFHPHATLSQPPGAVNLATSAVDGVIKLWPLPTPERKRKRESPMVESIGSLTGHTDRLTRLAWHASGRFIVSGSYDTTWRLWDVQTETCVQVQDGHSRPVYGIAVHPDGSLVASGDLGGHSFLWDLRTGKQVFSFLGHAKQILGIDFSPLGYQVASCSGDPAVRVWDLRRKKCSYTIPAHSQLISSVKFQPGEGHFLFTSSYDGTAKIWSSTGFSLVKTLAGPGGRMMRVEMSPDNEMIATTSFDRTWKLWIFETPETTAAREKAESLKPKVEKEEDRMDESFTIKKEKEDDTMDHDSDEEFDPAPTAEDEYA